MPNQRQLPRRVVELAPVGVVGKLVRVFKLPDNKQAALVQLLRRAQPIELLQRKAFPIARVLYPNEVIPSGKVFDATLNRWQNEFSNEAALLRIKGVGQAKAEAFG